MRLVRCGDESAFEAIFDRHHRGILSFCRHMLSSREEAEDAVQHTFAAAYRDLVGSDKPIQLKAWLYTIARNRCLSILRARKEQVSLEDAEPATEGLASEVQRRQDLRDMLADLARLPEDQRAALVLAELGALSHDEIGVALGVRKDKVKALVFQARESLASSRQARETDCQEIQEQLAVLSGGALRRTQIRRHVEQCPACAAFKAEVKRQRAAMAVLLPVVPSTALRDSVLAAIFGGGGAAGGGALLGGGAVTGGGLAAAAGAKGLAAKVLAIAVVAGGATGGGLMAVDELSTAPADSGARAIAAPPDEGGTVKLVATLRDRARRAAVQRERDFAAARSAAGTPTASVPDAGRDTTASIGRKRKASRRRGSAGRVTRTGQPSAAAALPQAPVTSTAPATAEQSGPPAHSNAGGRSDAAKAKQDAPKAKKDNGPSHETPRRGKAGNSPANPPGQQKRSGAKSKRDAPTVAAPGTAGAITGSEGATDDRHGKDHASPNGAANGNGHDPDKEKGPKEKAEKLVTEIVPVDPGALAPVAETPPPDPPPLLAADVVAALDAILPDRPFVQG